MSYETVVLLALGMIIGILIRISIKIGKLK